MLLLVKACINVVYVTLSAGTQAVGLDTGMGIKAVQQQIGLS